MASNDNPCCCGLFAIFLGITLFYSGISTYWKKKQMENIPTSKVRSVALGMVEVFGKAAGEVCKSPLLNKDAVYYRLEVYERVRQGKHSRDVLRFKEESKTPLYLDDDTGRILIDVKKAEFNLDMDMMKRIGDMGKDAELQKRAEQLLKQHGLSPKRDVLFGILGSMYGNYNFKEFVLSPGDPLYVLGTAMKQKGVESDLSSESLFIGRPDDGALFYVADKPESKLVGTMSYMWILQVIGGAGAIIVGLIFVLLGTGVVG